MVIKRKVRRQRGREQEREALSQNGKKNCSKQKEGPGGLPERGRNIKVEKRAKRAATDERK